VCQGKDCKKADKKLFKTLKSDVKRERLRRTEVFKTKCLGRCKFAPVVAVQPANQWCYRTDVDEVIKTIKGS
jgi:NADH:ubiquinone oxidoreductase subunit E